MTEDPFTLQRFVKAQAKGEPQDYETALAEIRAGQKRTHWIWYIFPQLRELGRSEMAKFYGIGSLDEARAYLAHPSLGLRLRECVAALQPLTGATVGPAFGTTDTMKLRSSLTLFSEADDDADGGAPFAEALARLFEGPDPATLRLLQR